MDTVIIDPVLASSVMPGPSCPKINRHSRGSVVSSSRTEPGTLSTATGVSPASSAKASNSAVVAWCMSRW